MMDMGIIDIFDYYYMGSLLDMLGNSYVDKAGNS
jgi:hypothetical protein